MPRNEESSDPNLQIPNQLRRKYELNIMPGPNDKQKLIPLRNLKSSLIGSLVTVRGIVTKITEVKPLITVACYVCDVCGFEVYQTVIEFSNFADFSFIINIIIITRDSPLRNQNLRSTQEHICH